MHAVACLLIDFHPNVHTQSDNIADRTIQVLNLHIHHASIVDNTTECYMDFHSALIEFLECLVHFNLISNADMIVHAELSRQHSLCLAGRLGYDTSHGFL